MRKIWGKYFGECDGVVFLIDGADEERFDEVRGVIDELYTRRVLDDAGMPKIEKRKLNIEEKKDAAIIPPGEDLEGGGKGEQ